MAISILFWTIIIWYCRRTWCVLDMFRDGEYYYRVFCCLKQAIKIKILYSQFLTAFPLTLIQTLLHPCRKIKVNLGPNRREARKAPFGKASFCKYSGNSCFWNEHFGNNQLCALLLGAVLKATENSRETFLLKST